ncbi:hypothetical protein B989_02253 [Brucella sp. 56/94]|uniref:hypothetical protein n=1 Tax=Brucella TaxID=234 RepID=UPI0001B47930|nr:MULTISPECIES: hypothetical protein [Brucella]EEY05551.1 conserved hypothetical protein [Brucella pinnipedialis M163/99/10]ENR38511.1 hypothetical protein C063_02811 [Brucella suis F8/06-2]ENS99520.1 hypothetical protein B989_02253 [Brucella sp. 56/94]QPF78470.1 hypothetical protein IEN84_01510 [Brucella pinnipedialis]
MMDEDEAEYMRLVEALKAEAGRLSGLGVGIVAGLALDIASDSRTFARVFGLAHALVLRELTALAQTGDYVRIRQRDARTQRTHYELGQAGHRLVEEVKG